MLKTNNKGFMLVEVIVTSAVVMTAMIGFYTSFNKLYNKFRIKNSYYNLDAKYATKEVINTMIESDTGNINRYIINKLQNNKYAYLIENSSCISDYTPLNCEKIQKLYSTKNIIIVNYSKNNLNELKKDENNLNQTFKDYIDYLITYYNLENSIEDYDYIVLTEIKDGNNYYYANLRMRWHNEIK